jgi:uncharacterized protein (TIGR00369 family)
MTHQKRVEDSQVELNQFLMPEHANPLGNVHGGFIMKMVDEAGALVALRHAQRPVVTVAIDSMIFHSPVRVGEVVSLHGRLNYVGRTSMEVGVEVIAENPLTGRRTHTNSAYVVYVALDDEGHPTEVPRLLLETEEQRQRWERAKARQARRLQEDAARTPPPAATQPTNREAD